MLVMMLCGAMCYVTKYINFLSSCDSDLIVDDAWHFFLAKVVFERKPVLRTLHVDDSSEFLSVTEGEILGMLRRSHASLWSHIFFQITWMNNVAPHPRTRVSLRSEYHILLVSLINNTSPYPRSCTSQRIDYNIFISFKSITIFLFHLNRLPYFHFI